MATIRDDLRANTSPSSGNKLSAKQILLGAVVLLCLVLTGRWAYLRFFTSEEDKIRAVIAEAAVAACNRSPGDVSVHLSEDFKGPLNMSKADAHLVISWILTFRRIEVTLSPTPIPVNLDPGNKSKATAEFRAVVRGKAEDESSWMEINPQAGGRTFHATFSLTEKGWKMSALSISE